ncbi:MAG: patatin-like phospholipase family protein [Cytophagales bacterium]|nr:patatin-like phospholipase family protein [Cytophagales bacterium]
MSYQINVSSKMKHKLNQIIHSFPIQLVFYHVRRNVAMLGIWIILIAAMAGGIGRVYGIQYLFLDPEYLTRVNFWSFFIVGITYGQLVMAFHMTSYILDSHRFTFLGILERPFAKFSVNNSIIPLVTFIVYVLLIVQFQLNNEFKNPWHIVTDLAGLASGMIILLIVSFFYFKWTNKDIFKYFAGNVDKQLRKSGLSRERMMKKLKETRTQKFSVHNYLDLELRIEKTDRLVRFYDKKTILKVFDQNHINSVIIGSVLIIMMIVLGGYTDNPVLQIPAAASAMLFFTMLIILVGAVTYWFRGWGISFVVGLFFVVNIAVKNGYISNPHEATGLNYSSESVKYSLDQLRKVNTPTEYFEDVHQMTHNLENWKKNQGQDKPKMILLCTSGGGQRAALWTLNAMQKLDSVTNGLLMNKTALITGASGGMIGAAYFREIYLRSLQSEDSISDEQYLENIARDNLNPVIFSLLVNDAFLKFRTYDYLGKTYSMDRGYAFEQNLNNNLGGIMDKKISDYAQDEQSGRIPTMILSPTIANDGRKLYITSRPFSFMNINETAKDSSKFRGVDYLRLFSEHDAGELSFITALRMSASFPYITPTIMLPSKPRMEVMDAGISDNFGVSDAIRFLYVFRKWVEENTSGVVLVIIRDTHPNEEIEGRPIPSIVDRLTYPIASVYNNMGRMQDRSNDSRIEQASKWFDAPMDIVELIYDSNENDTDQKRASLSWHLTTKEKHDIIKKIEEEGNKKALNKLRALIHSE